MWHALVVSFLFRARTARYFTLCEKKRIRAGREGQGATEGAAARRRAVTEKVTWVFNVPGALKKGDWK